MKNFKKCLFRALLLSASFAQAGTENLPVATSQAPLPQQALSGGIVMQNVAMRAAPKDSARQQADIWQGEWVEIRGSQLDYLQVYDYKRERGGYIKASAIRQTSMTEVEAPELLAVTRYLRDNNGSESLGISLATAYIKAAPQAAVNSAQGAEILDSIGLFADRLAARASSENALSKTAASQLAQQLEVAKQYGVSFNQNMQNNRMQMCYNGEVYRRVLGMPAAPAIHAHAALALTQETCINPDLTPLARAQMDAWRAQVIAHVDSSQLEAYLKNRVEMRRASILSALSYASARFEQQPEALKASGINEAPASLMAHSLQAFARVQKTELPDNDFSEYNNTAMRINASRWAAMPSLNPNVSPNKNTLQVKLETRAKGETCVLLTSQQQKEVLAKHCTFGMVWAQSANINREQNAVALAVQPLAGWRELWLFRKDTSGWQVQIIPPAMREANLGYAEFAGWVPGGKQMLVAKESRAENIYEHSFAIVNLDSLSTQRQANDARVLGAFQRWQDASWKANSVSVR